MPPLVALMMLPLAWWWGIATKWQYPNTKGIEFNISLGMSLFAAELQDRGTIVGIEFGFKGKKPKVLKWPLNCLNCPVKPQRMTPQEKIEKLRRRQQIQAMLAIQKQQQQLLLIILPVLFKLLFFFKKQFM